MVAKMLNLLEIGINKLSPKLTKEKEKEKEVAIYWKIIPLEALVDCLKGFLSHGNVCSQITNVDISNLVEGQLMNHVHGKKIDELCGVGWTKVEGALVCYTLQ